MNAKIIFGSETNCAGGKCPTVFLTDRNTYLIQGFKVVSEELQSLDLDIPKGEDIVELPEEFVEAFIKAQTRS